MNLRPIRLPLHTCHLKSSQKSLCEILIKENMVGPINVLNQKKVTLTFRLEFLGHCKKFHTLSFQ